MRCPGSKFEVASGMALEFPGVYALPQFEAACDDVPSLTDVDSPYSHEAERYRPLRYGRSSLASAVHWVPWSVLRSRITSPNAVFRTTNTGRPSERVTVPGTRFRFA